ncbi:enoyl-CoA hydratase/isomerase family protein [Natrinema sp. 74]|uniref:enoyl-CoA hydratase/isomerase family protein n=1 Tax=Natrinema sp. 74 TaxID=3384159 RepID=UPI0038D44934
MASTVTELVETKQNGDLLTISLNRPEKLNALTPELINGVYEVFEDLAADPGAHVLLTGNGDVTCAGMDTDIVASDDYDTEFGDVDETMRQLCEHIGEYPYPTAMAGKGAVIGAAFGMSVECDFVILGEDTTFSFPEITYDVCPSVSRIEHLGDVVGPRVAKEMVMTGEPIDPSQARALGLVNAVVPEDEVDAAATKLLEKISEHEADIVRQIGDVF